MKNVAIMGGAFDPVHMDHVTVARLCLRNNLCDEVWFVPSPDRWDKRKSGREIFAGRTCS